MLNHDLQDREIEEIFRNNLKIESNPMSIETLFTGRLRTRIKYDPYYQRNYVWDKQKASYFIESILLGTEIPPLIFFNSGDIIEVIDGRQRFQSIDRFMKEEFELTKKGLISLKKLARMKYEDLPDTIKNTFLDTTLRVIEFTIVATNEIDESLEDIVKKEIFRRYNSGITPLRKAEIQKAIFIDDDVTDFFQSQMLLNKQAYQDIVSIFLSERDQSRIDDPRLIDVVMMNIRKLLVLPEVPIRYYESTPGKEVASVIYENLSENGEPQEIFHRFMKKVSVLKRLQQQVSTKTPSNNRYLYETLYWALALLEKEDSDIGNSLSQNIVNNLAQHVDDYTYPHCQDHELEKLSSEN